MLFSIDKEEAGSRGVELNDVIEPSYSYAHDGGSGGYDEGRKSDEEGFGSDDDDGGGVGGGGGGGGVGGGGGSRGGEGGGGGGGDRGNNGRMHGGGARVLEEGGVDVRSGGGCFAVLSFHSPLQPYNYHNNYHYFNYHNNYHYFNYHNNHHYFDHHNNHLYFNYHVDNCTNHYRTTTDVQKLSAQGLEMRMMVELGLLETFDTALHHLESIRVSKVVLEGDRENNTLVQMLKVGEGVRGGVRW